MNNSQFGTHLSMDPMARYISGTVQEKKHNQKAILKGRFLLFKFPAEIAATFFKL